MTWSIANKAATVGVGKSQFARDTGKTTVWQIADALRAELDDCGLSASGETLREEQPDFVSMSEDEVVQRFLNVAEPKLGRSGSARVLDLVARLERLEDVSELARALRANTIAERVA